MGIGRFKFVLYVCPKEEGLGDEKLVHSKLDRIADMYDKYNMKYYHAAHEICPKTFRHHIDGYYEYASNRTIKAELKKWNLTFGHGFGDLQIAEGSAGENMDYSDKEGRRYDSKGEYAKGQGARTDLKSVTDAIATGSVTVDSLAVENPTLYHQYARTLHKCEDIALRKRFRTDMAETIWYCGPTGVGKSHKAFEGYHPDTHYLWKDDKGWQDGYTGQETVIINDFRGSIPYNQLLQMCDKWPYTVPRRGREPAPFLAKKIIITSSQAPDQVYHGVAMNDSLDQLLRRITVVEMVEKV